MNIKNMLLTTAAATLMVSAAHARDFTGSLFLPGQGEFLSDTQIEWSRTKARHVKQIKNFALSEELTYGLTDNFSVYGGIMNAFNFDRLTSRQYNNEHNFAYEVGAKYNYSYDNILTQVGLGYFTFQPSSWFGHHIGGVKMDNDWYKELQFEAQVGYDMGNGLVPYTMFTLDSPIDQADRVIDYSVFAGVHKTLDKWALDGGVRYDFVTHGDNANQWYLQGEADYFLTDSVAVGVHGDYFLGGSDYQHDMTLGAQLKVLF
ncbi:MAG TPA: hypothetical protein DIC64_00150 [Alphaproteobacteria bacterium]|nr:hypothetical protein [Alphaproteobacteria bacterium]